MMDIFIILLKNPAFDEYIHHFNKRLAMQIPFVLGESLGAAREILSKDV